MKLDHRDIKRLLSHVRVEPSTGCMIWTGCIDRDGYAQFKVNGRKEKAHRVLKMHVDGFFVSSDYDCHHEVCNCRSCINPAHTQWRDGMEHRLYHIRKVNGSR